MKMYAVPKSPGDLGTAYILKLKDKIVDFARCCVPAGHEPAFKGFFIPDVEKIFFFQLFYPLFGDCNENSVAFTLGGQFNFRNGFQAFI